LELYTIVIQVFMICKIEYVVIHMFQIPLDWNGILGFGIHFSDERYRSRKNSERNS